MFELDIQDIIINFNSIKVRLKPPNARWFNVPAIFQFHKGTIKTNLTMILFLLCLISIP